MRRAGYLLSACFPILLITAVVSTQPRAADLILTGGKVFTSDPARPYVEAIAIRGGRIIAVGANSEIEAFAGKRTRRVNLGGRVVVPGFNDAHFHFTPDPSGHNLRFESPQPGQPPEPSWDEAAEAVGAAVKQVPRGTWIFGEVGLDVIAAPQATRETLDRLAPDHPVLLRTYYGHGYLINSRAMPLFRIAEEEPDPAGGWYERVPGTNRINGKVWEYAQWKVERALAGAVSDADAVRLLRKMSDEAVGYGITSMQVMSSMRVERFVSLLAQADLPIRVRAIPFPETTPRGRDLSELKQVRGLRVTRHDVKVGGIKWILDGTPLERGAALRRPYLDRPGWKGRLLFGEAEVVSMAREALSAGQQLLAHCSGDRCAEAVFDSMEKAGGGVKWERRRWRIEHGDGVTGDLIPRAGRLGVVVVQNPTHFTYPELFGRRWGAGMMPLRSLLASGVHVALGSDGPMNPFLNVMLASVHPYSPKEAVTREQAVVAYTRGSAYAEFGEGEKGTIAAGKLADLAVLSQDIFNARPDELPRARSLLTVIGGKVVYDAKVLN